MDAVKISEKYSQRLKSICQ